MMKVSNFVFYPKYFIYETVYLKLRNYLPKTTKLFT